MTGRRSRFAEAIVQLVPSTDEPALPVRAVKAARVVETGGPSRKKAGEAEPLELKRYYALVYAYPDVLDLKSQAARYPGQPEAIAGLPCIAKLQFEIKSAGYREYLKLTQEGEAADGAKLWNNLFGSMSDKFRPLMTGALARNQPLRLWLNSVTPDLGSVPWEVLVYGSAAARASDRKAFSFVRGLPSDEVRPRVPISAAGKLRLALIYQKRNVPDGLLKALLAVKTVEVVPLTEAPRDALQRAAQEGFELVHLVTDGSVSLGSEGILVFRGVEPNQPTGNKVVSAISKTIQFLPGTLPLLGWLLNPLTSAIQNTDICTPDQVARIMRGSRVTLLALSGLRPSRTDTIGHLLPSVYRGLARFAASTAELPSMVVELGRFQTPAFWTKFYAELAETLSIEDSLALSRATENVEPAALFLRHQLARQFMRADEAAAEFDAEPTHVAAELALARELLQTLQEIGSDAVHTERFKMEAERQEKLAEKLNSFTATAMD